MLNVPEVLLGTSRGPQEVQPWNRGRVQAPVPIHGSMQLDAVYNHTADPSSLRMRGEIQIRWTGHGGRRASVANRAEATGIQKPTRGHPNPTSCETGNAKTNLSSTKIDLPSNLPRITPSNSRRNQQSNPPPSPHLHQSAYPHQPQKIHDPGTTRIRSHQTRIPNPTCTQTTLTCIPFFHFRLSPTGLRMHTRLEGL